MTTTILTTTTTTLMGFDPIEINLVGFSRATRIEEIHLHSTMQWSGGLLLAKFNPMEHIYFVSPNPLLNG